MLKRRLQEQESIGLDKFQFTICLSDQGPMNIDYQVFQMMAFIGKLTHNKVFGISTPETDGLIY